jgi:lysophospholipase L1-like esterase
VTRSRAARWAVAAVVAVGAPLAVAVPAQAQPAPGEPGAALSGTYVALGDSYTAGPLIPLQTGNPPGCLRSNRNYPSLVAETLGTGVTLRDVSCSGATTDDLAEPQATQIGTNPAQFEALDAEVMLVTLGIGGNDIGFAGIIAECAARSPREPFGSACKDFYTAGGSDELAQRIEETAPKIAAALAGIEERSPDARVLLVGYPVILPDSGPGCFPVVPFSAGDVAYLRETEKRLNAMLAAEADAAGVDYVDTYTPSIGHDVCQLPGRKWVEGLVPTSPAAPVHPNALGMISMSTSVLGELASESVLEPAA